MNESDVTGLRIFELLEKQGYRCLFTGWKLTPQTASIDHVTPLKKGGEHMMHNLAVVHRDVNHAKGSLTVEQFQELCQAVVDWSKK